MTDPVSNESPWAESADEVLGRLGVSSAAGLSDAEVRSRLARFGPNRLRQAARRSTWAILWDQFASLIVALLLVASIVAFAFQEHVEGFAIIAVVLINAAIGFFTERRALRTMEALRELGHTESTVRRNGSLLTLSAEQLVPGDIVVLDAGDVLSADLRLIASSRMKADESALTGESLPVDKSSAAVASDTALAERSCMLHKGTALTRGAGEGVVVATGMQTELGRISSLVESAEPEVTPLEKRLDRLGRRLIGLTVVVAALVAVAVVMTGRDLYLAVEIGIALAVATIPEGLPIVATVALARGMWRMARQNALIEELAAVETLGSTTLILTDKTGTLTENRMTVVEVQLDRGMVEVEGTGLEIEGAFRIDEQEVPVDDLPELRDLLQALVLCNNASLEERDGEVQVTGDPTEVALLVAGRKAGIDHRSLVEQQPEILEVAFDPDTKRMATVHRSAAAEAGGTLLAAVKGAPEVLLDGCTTVRTQDGSRAFDDGERQVWLDNAEQMAARGERVLAVARVQLTEAPAGPADFRFEGLELLGLVASSDPARASVRPAIEGCHAAGIRIVMVTGDHGATAWNIASEVGLIDPGPEETPTFVDGRELRPLAELSEAECADLRSVEIFARASPAQKLDLIEMHQQSGEVVAMTGDGVNDAPALKKADIGVAMGQRGTQVAREAAAMVLQDDEFGTIVNAVAQGRAIFANIRKFVVYLMTCNVSEILAIGVGVVAQGPLPILPLQILFLNLVTDVFPALALGVSEGSPALMRQAPRDPKESMLSRHDWRTIFSLGAVMAASALLALAITTRWLQMPDDVATTVTFLTIAMAQLWHVFSMRDRDSHWLRNETTRNPWVWAALALCMVLLLLAVYLPPLAAVLSIEDPGWIGWGVALSASLIPLVVGQLRLLWLGRASQKSR